jgi:hypothetical protein
MSNTPFAALLGKQIKVGSISYYNGTFLNGNELTGLTLYLELNFANPAVGVLTKSFSLGLNSTPNNGAPDENAGDVYLPSLQSITTSTSTATPIRSSCVASITCGATTS